MKVNKRNPLHWLWLVMLSVNVVLAVIARKFVSSSGVVVLYGHKLNGNLAAIYRKSHEFGELNLTYLTMDFRYYRKLKREGVSVVWGGSLQAVKLLVNADVLVSDHGLHSLVLLLDYSNLKFIDVWHGIPFKGFDKDDFRVQQRYYEVWVASKFIAELYVKKFGFEPEKLKSIGYARTDILVHSGDVDRNELMRAYGIPVSCKKIVLYAPTWQQDDDSRSLYPFGMTETVFLNELSQLADVCDTIFLIRTHINSGTVNIDNFDNIFAISAEFYPDTERLLLLTDVLIYDWSSIAFDFLLLGRPAIYFDVPPPFKKGFSLDGNYRYGEKVSNPDEFVAKLASKLTEKECSEVADDGHRGQTRSVIYECYADGRAAERACRNLVYYFRSS